MSKDCHRFWVDIMTPQHCRGSAKPLIFVCDASVEPFPQVIRCRSDQSLAATFCTFPKWLYISKDAKDTAAGVPLSDMYASDCEEMLQVIVRCARQMLRELPHQNTRRRRMTALLQECCRVEQYQRSLAQNQNKPFQTLAMRYHDFLAYVDAKTNLQEPATVFFTSAHGRHLPDLSIFQRDRSMATHVAMEVLRCNLRVRFHQAMKQQHALSACMAHVSVEI